MSTQTQTTKPHHRRHKMTRQIALMEPKINNNGTSREALIRQRMAARSAVLSAVESMMQMAPHGRDYLGDDVAYKADRDIHWDRLTALSDLAEDILNEALALKASGICR